MGAKCKYFFFIVVIISALFIYCENKPKTDNNQNRLLLTKQNKKFEDIKDKVTKIQKDINSQNSITDKKQVYAKKIENIQNELNIAKNIHSLNNENKLLFNKINKIIKNTSQKLGTKNKNEQNNNTENILKQKQLLENLNEKIGNIKNDLENKTKNNKKLSTDEKNQFLDQIDQINKDLDIATNRVDIQINNNTNKILYYQLIKAISNLKEIINSKKLITKPKPVTNPQKTTTKPKLVTESQKPTTKPKLVTEPQKPTTKPKLVTEPQRPTTKPVTKPDPTTIELKSQKLNFQSLKNKVKRIIDKTEQVNIEPKQNFIKQFDQFKTELINFSKKPKIDDDNENKDLFEEIYKMIIDNKLKIILGAIPYQEKQERSYCLKHSINNILGSEVFTIDEFYKTAKDLSNLYKSTRGTFATFKYQVGLGTEFYNPFWGNFNIGVLEKLKNDKKLNFELIFIGKILDIVTNKEVRKPKDMKKLTEGQKFNLINKINKDNIEALIINLPGKYTATDNTGKTYKDQRRRLRVIIDFTGATKGNHYFALKKIAGLWYNTDSKLPNFGEIGDDNDLIEFIIAVPEIKEILLINFIKK